MTAAATDEKLGWVREAAGKRFGISFLVVSELDATRFAPAIEELRHR
jgi:hypothetical protein